MKMIQTRAELSDRVWHKETAAPKKHVHLGDFWSRVADELNKKNSSTQIRSPSPPDGEACQQKHYYCLMQLQACAKSLNQKTEIPAWARDAEVLIHLLGFPHAFPSSEVNKALDTEKFTPAAAYAISLLMKKTFFGNKKLRGWTLTTAECRKILSFGLSTKNRILLSGKTPKSDRVNDWLEAIKAHGLSKVNKHSSDYASGDSTDSDSESSSEDDEDKSTSDSSRGIESLSEEEDTGDNTGSKYAKGFANRGRSGTTNEMRKSSIMDGEMTQNGVADERDSVAVIAPKKYLIFRQDPFSETTSTVENVEAHEAMNGSKYAARTAPYGMPFSGAEKRLSDALLIIVKHEKLTEKEKETLTLAQLAMELAKYRPFIMGVAKLACIDNHHLHVGAFMHLVANRMEQLGITFGRIATDLTKY
eukprot:gb/GECG01012830.1/.p1 GENE.gb/GECG01012830.1/~~gb/GECG01012830.1/.p1  ORF type:complete len:418 (+),score=58.90 gb/GECG01012830.1/:1-1254(+)